MDPIKKASAEFKALEAYARDTHGATHRNINVSIINAYRVERSANSPHCNMPPLTIAFRAGETEAWAKAGFDQIPDGDRLLLWHGSRTTNFAGV